MSLFARSILLICLVTGLAAVAFTATSVPSSQVSTTASGLAKSRMTHTFKGTLTIKNVSAAAINGPLQVVFTSLTSGVTLANATGSISGTPFLTVPANLAPGQLVTISLQFTNPSNARVNFAPAIYSGSFN